MDKETIRMLQCYLSLPSMIEAEEQELKRITDQVIAECHLYGEPMNYDPNKFGQTPVDKIVELILIYEKTAVARLRRWKKRLDLFKQWFTLNEWIELQNLHTCKQSTLKKAVEWLKEVEYFIEQHHETAKNKPIQVDTKEVEELEKELFEMFEV